MPNRKEQWTITIVRSGNKLHIRTTEAFTYAYSGKEVVPSLEVAESNSEATELVLAALIELCPDL